MSKRKSEPERPFLGEFTIDPKTEEFKDLKSVCERGNPWRCLIGTAASIHVGRRVTVRLDHEKHAGVIGLTYGGHRYERPMTPDEVVFATKFDLGQRMRAPLCVRFDLGDGTWTARPKDSRKKGPGNAGNRKKRTIRGRQLKAIREAYAGGV